MSIKSCPSVVFKAHQSIMLLVSLIVFACFDVSSATSLPRTAEWLTLARVGSHIPIKDFMRSFDVARLLDRRPDFFLDAAGNDMVESMRVALNLKTKRDAADYFVAHNYPEIRAIHLKMLETTSDPVIVLLMSNAVTLIDEFTVRPIIDLVADYLTLITQPCLVSSLPITFSDPAQYDAMFTPVDRLTYRVSRNYIGEDVLAVLHDEVIQQPWTELWISSWNSTTISVERKSSIEVERNYTRMVDLRSGCAVDVNANFEMASLYPERRIFSAWAKGTNLLSVWRGDEIRVMNIPKEGFISIQSNVEMMELKSYFPGEDHIWHHTFSTDLSKTWVISGSLEPSQAPGMKNIRVFFHGPINDCSESVILFSAQTEIFIYRLIHLVHFENLRHLFAQMNGQTRAVMELFMAGRFLTAFKEFRRLAPGSLEGFVTSHL